MSATYTTPGGRGRRVCSAREFIAHAFMPYGAWTDAAGREILFNRSYEPLWTRQNGVVSPIDPTDWIAGIKVQRWFYQGGKTTGQIIQIGTSVLMEWGVRSDFQKTDTDRYREPK